MPNEDIASTGILLGSVYLQKLFVQRFIIAFLVAYYQLMRRKKIVKVSQFYELTVPNMTPRMYRRYFRMYPHTLFVITEHIAQSQFLQQIDRYIRIPVGKKLAMTCAYIGSSYPTLQLAHLFDVAEESFLRVTEQVIDALLEKIQQFIYWPSENELPLYGNQFDGIGRFFPQVVGALDDIHLEIKLTEEQAHRRSYYCWKQYYSIHLQAVSTYDLRFLDIFVGWPGRSHDSRVFHQNPLYLTLPARLRHRRARDLMDTFHIVADSAFPCSPQVLTPFRRPRNRDLNVVEKKYNTHLSSKRNNVERAFGLLLQRFPRLLKLNQKTLMKKIKVVMAACILHNICILENDNIQFFLERARRVRQRPLNQRYRPLGTLESNQLGRLKRLHMANIVFQN